MGREGGRGGGAGAREEDGKRGGEMEGKGREGGREINEREGEKQLTVVSELCSGHTNVNNEIPGILVSARSITL